MKTQNKNNIVVSLSADKERSAAYTTQQAETIADLKYILQLVKDGARAYYDTTHLQDLNPIDKDALSIQGWNVCSYDITDYATVNHDRVAITVLDEVTASEAEDCIHGCTLNNVNTDKAEKFARIRRTSYLKKHFEQCQECGVDYVHGVMTWGIFTKSWKNGKHISKITESEAVELLAGVENDWTRDYYLASFAGSLEEAARAFTDCTELTEDDILEMIEAAEKGE